MSIENLKVFPILILAVLVALATFEPPLANIPQESVPPLFTSELPLKNPAVPPMVVKFQAPNPTVVSFCPLTHVVPALLVLKEERVNTRVLVSGHPAAFVPITV